jgi:hypothetical protein
VQDQPGEKLPSALTSRPGSREPIIRSQFANQALTRLPGLAHQLRGPGGKRLERAVPQDERAGNGLRWLEAQPREEGPGQRRILVDA